MDQSRRDLNDLGALHRVSADQPTQRIGVFGGTFDPVHNGHLHIANALRLALDLDRLIWVPAGRPPHKSGQIVSTDRDRLAMLELALAGTPTDEISLLEMNRPGPSFTADTLELLRAQTAPAQRYFLMGEDSLRDLPTWHEPERILRNAELAVAGRPGVEVDLTTLYRSLPDLRGRVHIIPTTELAIASSAIRQRAAAGLPLDNLVPPAVAAYIARNNLYANDGTQPYPLSQRTGRGGRG